MFKFETSKIWNESIRLASEIYDATRFFPSDVIYDLTLKLAQAGVSVSINIAEGSRRETNENPKAFIQSAIDSINEILTHLKTAKANHYVNGAQFSQLYKHSQRISNMLFEYRDDLTETEKSFLADNNTSNVKGLLNE